MAAALLTVAGCDVFVSPAERVTRAEHQIAAHDYTAASVQLRKALKSRPDNAQAHFLLARVALELDDPQGALEELQRALDLGLRPAVVADLQARVDLALGRFQPLLDQIDSGQLPLPQPSRSIYRGNALQGLKRDAEALAAYQSALSGQPHSEEARVAIAEIYTEQGEFDAALASLEALITDRPDSAQGWLLRGTVLARRGQFTQAEESLHKALAHSEQLTAIQRAGMFMTLLETRLATGDTAGAAAVQAQLVGLAPQSTMARFATARVAVARQDYATATAELQRLLAATPDFLPGRFLLGTTLLAQGHLEQAEQELAEVVQATPANLEARKLLTGVRLRSGRPEAALRALLPALEAKSTDEQVRALLENAQSQLATDDAGVAFLEQSVATHPENDALKVSLATAYLRNQQEAKAVTVLSQTSGTSRLSLARLYLHEGQQRQADEVVAQVLAAAPGRADVLDLAGLLYLEAGRYEQALARLRAAADLEPTNPGFWTSVARAQLALQQSAAAQESLNKALQARSDWLPAIALLSLMDAQAGRADAAVARVVQLEGGHERQAPIFLLEGDVRMAVRQYAEAAKAFAEANRLHPSSMATLRSYAARRLAKIPDPAQPLRDWLLREPDDLPVRITLAEDYESSDPQKAIEEYERILLRQPRNAIVLNNLAWLYQAKGDQRALELARQAHELAPQTAAVTDTYGWILLQQGQTAAALPLLKAAAASAIAPIVAHYAEAQKRFAAANKQR